MTDAGLCLTDQSTSEMTGDIPAKSGGVLLPSLLHRSQTSNSITERIGDSSPISQLAIGAAHDLGNLVAVIRASLDRLGEISPGQPLDRDAWNTAQKAVDEAQRLVSSLLAIGSGWPSMDRGTIALSDLLESAGRLIKRLLPLETRLVVEVSEDAPLYIIGDEHELLRVLVNLAINASDAMPDGGELRVSGRKASAMDVENAGLRNRSAGYIRLDVSDSGRGMTRDVAARAFEPSFTTKDRDGRSGLGLPSTRSIIDEHDGYISIESESGRGCTVTLLLPLAEGAHRSQPLVSASPCGRGELVVLAEPLPEVREFLSVALRNLGYRVVEVEDESTACKACLSHRVELGVCVFDVDMQRGRLREVCKATGDAALVIFTSHTDLRVPKRKRAARIVKPFRISELARVIRNLLDFVE